MSPAPNTDDQGGGGRIVAWFSDCGRHDNMDHPRVTRLGAHPLSVEGSEAYLADIVIGTREDFVG